jgi:predicted DNA-binding protein
MRTERRRNGSAPHPAVSFRLPVEVKAKLKALAIEYEKNDTQMLISLIERGDARTKL